MVGPATDYLDLLQSKQHRRPDYGMEPEDIFADYLKCRRPQVATLHGVNCSQTIEQGSAPDFGMIDSLLGDSWRKCVVSEKELHGFRN